MAMTKKQIARKLMDLGFASVDITDDVMSPGSSCSVSGGIAIDVPLSHSPNDDWGKYRAVIGRQSGYVAGMIRNSNRGRLMVRAERA